MKYTELSPAQQWDRFGKLLPGKHDDLDVSLVMNTLDETSSFKIDGIQHVVAAGDVTLIPTQFLYVTKRLPLIKVATPKPCFDQPQKKQSTKRAKWPSPNHKEAK